MINETNHGAVFFEKNIIVFTDLFLGSILFPLNKILIDLLLNFSRVRSSQLTRMEIRLEKIIDRVLENKRRRALERAFRENHFRN